MFTRGERRALPNCKLELITEKRTPEFTVTGASTIPLNHDFDRSNIFKTLVEENVLLTDAQDYQKKEICGQFP